MKKMIAMILFTLMASAPAARAGDAEYVEAVWKAYELAEVMTVRLQYDPDQRQGSDVPDACVAALDQLTAAGKSGTTRLRLKGGKSVTLSEARRFCEELAATVRAHDEAATSRVEAERAEVEAKYRKAGMKGDRLELFVDTELNGGTTWYGKGCDAEITSLKTLARAKKLFRFVTYDDGEIKVTRYTFKGHRYKTAVRRFYLPERAHDWCK
jgi:hypothetical protein